MFLLYCTWYVLCKCTPLSGCPMHICAVHKRVQPLSLSSLDGNTKSKGDSVRSCVENYRSYRRQQSLNRTALPGNRTTKRNARTRSRVNKTGFQVVRLELNPQNSLRTLWLRRPNACTVPGIYFKKKHIIDEVLRLSKRSLDTDGH